MFQYVSKIARRVMVVLSALAFCGQPCIAGGPDMLQEPSVVAVHPAAATPAPSPTPLPDVLRAHAVLRIDGTSSFLVGSGDKANLFQPINSAANVGWLLRYANSWDDGLLKVSYQKLFTNDVQDHLLQTLASTLNIHSVRSELDKYEIRREWDQCIPDCTDPTERVEAAIGTMYSHPGPQFVNQPDAITGSYHATYALVDYFFGSPIHEGFDGSARHFDILLQISRGTHSVLQANGTPENGAKILYSWAPTYSYSLTPDGRTYGYVSYTNASHVYDGIAQPLHTDDYEIGIVRQMNRKLYVELHLNTLTKQGVTTPQYLPYSLNHAGVDLVVRYWLNRPS